MYNSSLLKRGKTPFDILPSAGDQLPDYKTYQHNPRIHSVGESYELKNYITNPIVLDRMNVNDEYNRHQASNEFRNEINGQQDEKNDRNDQEKQKNQQDKYEIEIKGTRSVYSRKFNGLSSPLEQLKQQTVKQDQRQEQQTEQKYVNPFRSAKKYQLPESRQSFHQAESSQQADFSSSLQAPMFKSQNVFNDGTSNQQFNMNPKRSNGFTPSVPVYETEEIPEFRQTLSTLEKDQAKTAEPSNYAEQKYNSVQPFRIGQSTVEKEQPQYLHERIPAQNQQKEQLQFEKQSSQLPQEIVRFNQSPFNHREQILPQLRPETNFEQIKRSSPIFEPKQDLSPVQALSNYPQYSTFFKNEPSTQLNFPFDQQQASQISQVPRIIPSPSLPIETAQPVHFIQSQPQLLNQPPPLLFATNENLIQQPQETAPSHFVSFEPQLACPQPIVSPLQLGQQELFEQQQQYFQPEQQFNQQQQYMQVQQQQQPIQPFQQIQQPQSFPDYLQSYQQPVFPQQQQFASQQILPAIEQRNPLQIHQQPYYPTVVETPLNYPPVQAPNIPSNSYQLTQPRFSKIQSSDYSFPPSDQYPQINPYDQSTRILGREHAFTKQSQYSQFDKSTPLPALADPYFQRHEESAQPISRYQQQPYNNNDAFSFQQKTESDLFSFEKPQVFLRGAKYF